MNTYTFVKAYMQKAAIEHAFVLVLFCSAEGFAQASELIS